MRINMKNKKKFEGMVVSPDDSYKEIKKNLIEMLKKQGITIKMNKIQKPK